MPVISMMEVGHRKTDFHILIHSLVYKIISVRNMKNPKSNLLLLLVDVMLDEKTGLESVITQGCQDYQSKFLWKIEQIPGADRKFPLLLY